MEELSFFQLRDEGALLFAVKLRMAYEMEELPHVLLVSRGALLCLVEKEKSFLLSQLATEELSQFANLK